MKDDTSLPPSSRGASKTCAFSSMNCPGLCCCSPNLAERCSLNISDRCSLTFAANLYMFCEEKVIRSNSFSHLRQSCNTNKHYTFIDTFTGVSGVDNFSVKLQTQRADRHPAYRESFRWSLPTLILPQLSLMDSELSSVGNLGLQTADLQMLTTCVNRSMQINVDSFIYLYKKCTCLTSIGIKVVCPSFSRTINA